MQQKITENAALQGFGSFASSGTLFSAGVLGNNYIWRTYSRIHEYMCTWKICGDTVTYSTADSSESHICTSACPSQVGNAGDLYYVKGSSSKGRMIHFLISQTATSFKLSDHIHNTATTKHERDRRILNPEYHSDHFLCRATIVRSS